MKINRSSDQSLQLKIVKLESLVIVDQLRHGEYVTESSTHRPSRHGSWRSIKCNVTPLTLLINPLGLSVFVLSVRQVSLASFGMLGIRLIYVSAKSATRAKS